MFAARPVTGIHRITVIHQPGADPRTGRAHRIHVMRFHLPARDHVVMDWAPALYAIRVDGHLGPMTLSAFPGMTPLRKGPHTMLTGWLDQSALYGVLAELEALGLALLEVRQLEPPPTQGGQITEIQ